MQKAIDEIQKRSASRQIIDAINTQNRSSTTYMHNLSINLPVLVYQEVNIWLSGEWKRLYNLLSI